MKRSQGMFVAAVAAHRAPQRAHRGDLLRPRAGQGVRSSARRRAGVRRGERGAVPGVVLGAVRERPDHADHDVHREPQLRAGRRHRRAAGGQRLAVPGRGPGVHPVQPPVHPAADASWRRWRTCCSPGWPRPSGSSSCSTHRGAEARPGQGPTRPRRDRAPRRGAFRARHLLLRPRATADRDLSLVADPGHTVAIVGPTGAGKTTLVNLVMRFYEVDGRAGSPSTGSTSPSMPRAELRSQTGMVLQDTWLFEGTHPRQHRLRAARVRPRSRSSRQPRRPSWTGSCTRCPTGTTR